MTVARLMTESGEWGWGGGGIDFGVGERQG